MQQGTVKNYLSATPTTWLGERQHVCRQAGRGASAEQTRDSEYTRRHSLVNTSPCSPEILQNNEMRELNPLGDALE